MRGYRVELVDPATGGRRIEGPFESELDAVRRILQIDYPGVVELWGEYALLARVDRSLLANDLKANLPMKLAAE